jgi:hypothetical protein
MARTADLGWAIARCDGTELELVMPASEDDPAQSMTIQGRENLITLQELIRDALQDQAMSEELEKDLPIGD